MKKRKNRDRSEMSVRQGLLESATNLFNQKGYAFTTVREIVETAGVTKPVLYYYFRNKEGIYLELMRQGFSKLDTLLDAFRERKTSAAQDLLLLCEQVFAILMEHLKEARLMYSIYYGPPQGAPFIDFDTYHRKLREAIKRLVRRGIRQREFPPGNVETITWAILGAVNLAMESQLCHPETGVDRKRLVLILRLIFHGISKGRPKRK